jgi:hypothetical protein
VPYLAVSLIYVVSRALLVRAGLPFGFELDWMWLADPADLENRLAETLWFFHAFPPGMPLLTGVLLKVGGAQAATLAHAVFWVLGVTLANGLVALGRAAGLSRTASALMSIGFLLSPPALYFEHLYLYEWLVVTLLVVSAVAFHRAAAQPTFARWGLFFGIASLIAVTRSTFHLMWFAVLVAGAVLAGGNAARRAALVGAVPGLLLVLLVYGKNEWLFGEFAASTFGPASLHLVTVDRMPRSERDRWIADGRLSPFASISPYAPPRDYARFFGRSDRPGWPPQVTRLERDRVAAPNFNHWFLLEAHRARRQDVENYLHAHPLRYLANVWSGLVAVLGPSTEWHPRTGTPASPHAGHRRVLGTYEAAYNRALHGFFAPPAGLYVLLPFVLAWSVWRAMVHLRSGEQAARARGVLIGYCTFQIVFVITISSMVTFLESSRYRFQVEPFIWVLVALLAVSLLPHGRVSDRRHV